MYIYGLVLLVFWPVKWICYISFSFTQLWKCRQQNSDAVSPKPCRNTVCKIISCELDLPVQSQTKLHPAGNWSSVLYLFSSLFNERNICFSPWACFLTERSWNLLIGPLKMIYNLSSSNDQRQSTFINRDSGVLGLSFIFCGNLPFPSRVARCLLLPGRGFQGPRWESPARITVLWRHVEVTPLH